MGHPAITREGQNQALFKAVERARGGDPAALDEIVTLFQNDLFRFCVYLTKDRIRAEDLAQTTLIRALERLSTLKNAESFVHWTYSIAKNLFLDQAHKQNREVPIEEAIEDSAQMGATSIPLRALELMEALDALSPEDRILILLADMEGLNTEELSKMMGLSEAAVRTRLYRARQTFIKIFESD